MRIRQTTLKGISKAAPLLNYYYRSAHTQKERLRLVLAMELCKLWKKNKIAIPPPARPESQDVWYLAQIFALGRHMLENGFPYDFTLEKDVTFYTDRSLFDSVITLASKNKPVKDVNRKGLGQVIVSRRTHNELLTRYGNSVVGNIGLSPKTWKLSPIPYDILLRYPHSLEANVFIDGYRKHPNGELTSFFGGGSQFGGAQHIDSLWLDQPIVITPLLVIIPKSYGQKA